MVAPAVGAHWIHLSVNKFRQTLHVSDDASNDHITAGFQDLRTILGLVDCSISVTKIGINEKIDVKELNGVLAKLSKRFGTTIDVSLLNI